MSDYRAYIVGNDGHFQDFVIIPADDDAAALKVAEDLTADHDIEIWLLDRKVAILPRKVSFDSP